MLSSNHSAALAKSKVMTTVDGAVTVLIILAGLFEWIITQSLLDQDLIPLFKSENIARRTPLDTGGMLCGNTLRKGLVYEFCL